MKWIYVHHNAFIEIHILSELYHHLKVHKKVCEIVSLVCLKCEPKLKSGTIIMNESSEIIRMNIIFDLPVFGQ